MALKVPTSYAYSSYVGIPGEQLRQTLLEDSLWNPRWRGDSSDRLHGGARRTYLPNPVTLLDAILFGGAHEFKKVMAVCIDAANALMRHVADEPWEANRVVINKMPPHGTLHEHVDPAHFEGGVVVIGVGEAELFYRTGVGVLCVNDPHENLVHIPPGVPHWVENGAEERVSVVVAHDVQIAAGMSAVRQKLANRGQ